MVIERDYCARAKKNVFVNTNEQLNEIRTPTVSVLVTFVTTTRYTKTIFKYHSEVGV